MTEIILSIVILLLLIHNFSIQRTFLGHLKQLELKMVNIEPEGKVATPNEISENVYRDISDVSSTEINK